MCMAFCVTIECVHRYYESRRCIKLEDTPEGKEKKEISGRKFRKIHRQKLVSAFLKYTIILNLFDSFTITEKKE